MSFAGFSGDGDGAAPSVAHGTARRAARTVARTDNVRGCPRCPVMVQNSSGIHEFGNDGARRFEPPGEPVDRGGERSHDRHEAWRSSAAAGGSRFPAARPRRVIERENATT